MPASRPSRIQAPVFEPILHWLCQCQVRCQLFILSHKNIGSSRRIRSIYSMRSVLSDSDSRAITDKTEEVSGAVYRELPPTGLFCLLAVERQRHFVTGLPIHSRFRRIERVGGTVSNQERFLARPKVRRYAIETEKLGALRFATFWKNYYKTRADIVMTIRIEKFP